MFKPITTMVILSQGLWFLTAEIPAGGTNALSVDWGSWRALMESLSAPLALRLAAWLVLGCGVGICMSALVRNLRSGQALVSGAFGGLAAAGVFLMALPRLGEMAGHLLAAAVLGLVVALMVARARARSEGGKQAADQASKSVPAAPDQSSAAPPPEPEAVPTAPSSSVPAPERKAAAGVQSAAPSESEMPGAAQSTPAPEAQSAPAPEAQSAPAPEAQSAPAPEAQSAAAGDASSQPPEATARPQKARKKSLQKTIPNKPNAPIKPDWMQ